ncbi:MAG: ABC transporter permease [Rhodothermales bacterium]
MLKNYLKITLRNLRRQKGYAFINIAGLAIGVACCLLLFLFIQYEAGFDTSHAKRDRIYRVLHRETMPDGGLYYRVLQFPETAPGVAEQVPGIESYTRLVRNNFLVRQDLESNVEPFFYADSTVFDVFTLPFVAGDPARSLRNPESAVISERIATKYFGTMDLASVVGQRLQVLTQNGPSDFVVDGVMRDMPAQSSLQMDILIPFAQYPNFGMGANNWGGRASTYLLLEEGQDPAAVEAAFVPLVRSTFADFIERRREAGYLADGDDAFRLVLQPLVRLHFQPEIVSIYEQATHNPLYSWAMGGIGLLVLLIACINFMTLAIGRSSSRSREVGVRKVLGARRGQLAQQFLGEAAVMSAAAVALAVILCWAALPLFKSLTGLPLTMQPLATPASVGALLLLAAAIGLLAGSYPTFVLSAFKPINALKGEARVGGRVRLTRGLVVFQYALAIALMIATTIMTRQLNYLRHKDLGFDSEQVVVLNTFDFSEQSIQTVESFKQALAGRPEIVSAAGAGYSFTRSYDTVSWQEPDGTPRASARLRVDYEYLDTAGMELVAGRNFSRDYPSDPTHAAIVNESFAKAFGWDQPIGQRLLGYNDDEGAEPLTVIGVVKDYHSRSLHEPIGPSFWHMTPSYGFGNVLVRVRPGRVTEALQTIEDTWKAVSPDHPFSFFFLDDDVQQQYAAERRWGQIVGYSTLFAILIASMGLVGLAALAASRRTKEIGVRKVLGASVPALVGLLSRDFLKLVALATVIAWPIAFFGMRRWLETFAYRSDMNAGIFLLVGLAAVLIAFLAIAYQAIRAAIADPVKSLRYE